MNARHAWVAVVATLGCDEDPLELRAATDGECDGLGGVVLQERNESFFACNGQPGPAGEAGRDGPMGEPGPAGDSSAGGPPNLGALRGFVACELSDQTNVGDPYTQRAKVWFFESGWSFASAGLSTVEDDESQSDFVPAGENPTFSFQGLPLLLGVITLEMNMARERFQVRQNENVLGTFPWNGPGCLDARE